jgi:nucleotide-binding universal stress UspA family protein
VKRATARGAALLLVHVIDDEWGQVGSQYAELEAAAGESLMNEATEFARSLHPDLQLTTEIRQGSPAWELISTATAGDLVVVGTHKTGYLRGRVLGTRSIVVASGAPCSVIVVPEEVVSLRRGVVVGVGPGTVWHDAVTQGALEAAALGQDLTLLYCSPLPEDTLADSGSHSRQTLAEASALATSIAPHLTVRSRVSRRSAAEALLDASRDASLLVVGVSRRNPVNAGFLGSVTHDVLVNINAPVMVARGSK